MGKKLDKAPFATHFFTDAFSIDGEQLMGRQAAGNSYLSALFKEKYENIALYIASIQEDPRIESNKTNIINFLNSSVDYSLDSKINLIPFTSPQESKTFGGIFRPDPKLSDLARHRSYFNHDTYSLIGITHTTASHNIMTIIKDMIVSPLMPWDALICTSESVRSTVETIHSDYLEYLDLRLGINKKPKFQLPVIPLGINIDDFTFNHELDPIKAKYKIDGDDINIIFVGRISFHAKAHNIPMFLALEQLSKDVDKKINFIMAGWFPNEAVEKWIKEEGDKLCPSVNLIYVDGRNQQNKFDIFSIGDIFFSLTDNIQETFGLTPLEAMASEMPVVVSDWDGYRETVRDGIDGFRVKTTSFPEQLSNALAYRFDIGADTYDRYCGYHSLFTAVDIEESIEKLKLLITNDDLRKELGKNARENAVNKFSWSTILTKYEELSDELNEIRLSDGKEFSLVNSKISSDRLSPFKVFSTYPTRYIDKNTSLKKLSNINVLSFSKLRNFESINYASIILPSQENIDQVFNIINDFEKFTIEQIMSKSTLNENDVFAIVTLLLKYGYIKITD